MSHYHEPSPTVNGQPFNSEDLQDIAPATPTEDVDGNEDAPEYQSGEEEQSTPSSQQTQSPRRSKSKHRSKTRRNKRGKAREAGSAERSSASSLRCGGESQRGKKKATKQAIREAKKALSSYDIPDYDSMSRDVYLQKQQQLLTKIQILSDNNPSYDINVPDSNTPCHDLHIYHKHTLHRIMTDEVVQNYTNYLILAWMGLEWVAVNVFKVDASGFAKTQISNLYKYKKQLIEIGERENKKSRAGSGIMSSWPPEVTLFVQSLISLAILIAINYYLGSNASQETKQQTYAQAMNLKNNVEKQAEEQGGIAKLVSNLMGSDGGINLGTIMNMFSGGGGGNNNAPAQQEVYDE
jgi:hypothetical protein